MSSKLTQMNSEEARAKLVELAKTCASGLLISFNPPKGGKQTISTSVYGMGPGELLQVGRTVDNLVHDRMEVLYLTYLKLLNDQVNAGTGQLEADDARVEESESKDSGETKESPTGYV